MAVEITQQEWKDLWEIVRATERQTSVQNESIKGLCDKLDTQSGLTDRYFEAMDKRAEEEARKFDEHMKLQRERDAEQARRFDALIKSQEDREARFWKAIAVLIGAVIVLAIGPKAAKSIYEACQNPVTAVGYYLPAVSNDQRDPLTLAKEQIV